MHSSSSTWLNLYIGLMNGGECGSVGIASPPNDILPLVPGKLENYNYAEKWGNTPSTFKKGVR